MGPPFWQKSSFLLLEDIIYCHGFLWIQEKLKILFPIKPTSLLSKGQEGLDDDHGQADQLFLHIMVSRKALGCP
jgi:hypothetical protein